jgi:hypothetical protein
MYITVVQYSCACIKSWQSIWRYCSWSIFRCEWSWWQAIRAERLRCCASCSSSQHGAQTHNWAGGSVLDYQTDNREDILGNRRTRTGKKRQQGAISVYTNERILKKLKDIHHAKGEDSSDSSDEWACGLSTILVLYLKYSSALRGKYFSK